ncbi:LysR family transcriptional regulator [Rhizobium sp. 16-449-1b]|uniref:LysR family transcriptional regulator n=1 Tax=Rhizobium sp. 16-449-1b TaxID=2819989 RepID=UPI001ADB57AC|nr:LysR family transcriptional regulator [Rhizobium sp. 16-449-1b]MBO9195948.1 LysR family transcriptional regulator [Rhizobium sp. 16-449-1b]
MLKDFSDTLAFVRVVQHGSFTSAAQALGVSKARISRKVRELEARLNVALLKRSTRRLGLTEAGRTLFEQSEPLFRALDEAEEGAAELSALASGKITITAPAWFSSGLLAPTLAEFHATQPELRLDMISTHEPLDLISEDVDIAFRLWIGELPASELVARHIATLPRRLFASARYAEERGALEAPEHLIDHPALITHVRKPSDTERLWLTNGTTSREFPIRAASISSDPEFLKAMMMAGNGLLFATELQMRSAIASGEAVIVLPEWRGWPVELYAVLPPGRRPPHKIRTLLDFLAPRLVRECASV